MWQGIFKVVRGIWNGAQHVVQSHGKICACVREGERGRGRERERERERKIMCSVIYLRDRFGDLLHTEFSSAGGSRGLQTHSLQHHWPWWRRQFEVTGLFFSLHYIMQSELDRGANIFVQICINDEWKRERKNIKRNIGKYYRKCSWEMKTPSSSPSSCTSLVYTV